jgi:hypothetical protein
VSRTFLELSNNYFLPVKRAKSNREILVERLLTKSWLNEREIDVTRASWECFVCGVALAVLAGCQAGSKLGTVPVSGTVTLDGQAVADVAVAFKPKASGGRGAVGVTAADGKFTLTTLQSGDGALPGSYAVTLTKSAAVEARPVPPIDKPSPEKQAKMAKYMGSGGKPPTSSVAPKNELPDKYASPETSGFTAEVKLGEKNDFTFAMTSK